MTISLFKKISSNFPKIQQVIRRAAIIKTVSLYNLYIFASYLQPVIQYPCNGNRQSDQKRQHVTEKSIYSRMLNQNKSYQPR